VTCLHNIAIRTREYMRTSPWVIKGKAVTYEACDDYFFCVRCNAEWHPDLYESEPRWWNEPHLEDGPLRKAELAVATARFIAAQEGT
jgi:hypothetical protein